MLPALFSVPHRTLIAGVTALAVLTAGTSPAQAWGKNEQQFLAGAVTALTLGAVIMSANRPRAQAQSYYQPHYQPPQYYQPQPPRYQPPVRYDPPVVYQPAQVSIYATPVGRAFNSYSSNEKRRIQSTLSAYGYYRGGIDGSFGPGTYGAIDAYARQTGKTAMLGTNSGAYGILDGLLF